MTIKNRVLCLIIVNSDSAHTGPDSYGHHINLKSFKTSMTLKFVIILHHLIKAYHRKSGRSKYDRKLTELDVETTRIRSRVNGVSLSRCLSYYAGVVHEEQRPNIRQRIKIRLTRNSIVLNLPWSGNKIFV